MQANSWHYKLLHFHLSFRVWKVCIERGKLQKFEHFGNESFKYTNKQIFKYTKYMK